MRKHTEELLKRIVDVSGLNQKHRYIRFVKGALIIVVLLILWQIAGTYDIINTKLLPAPLTIGYHLCKEGSTAVFWKDILDSVKRVIIGFLIASGVGVPLGLFLGWRKGLSDFFNPVLEVLRPIPPIAWIPLAVMWFGIGDAPAYFIVFLGAFFPTFINSYDGINSVQRVHINAARSLGASKSRLFFTVIFPSTLPHIMTGLRVSLGIGWMCVITAEMVGAKSGLGYSIQLNRILLQTEKVIAGMIVIGIIGYVMNSLIRKLEKKLVPWREND